MKNYLKFTFLVVLFPLLVVFEFVAALAELLGIKRNSKSRKQTDDLDLLELKKITYAKLGLSTYAKRKIFGVALTLAIPFMFVVALMKISTDGLKSLIKRRRTKGNNSHDVSNSCLGKGATHIQATNADELIYDDLDDLLSNLQESPQDTTPTRNEVEHQLPSNDSVLKSNFNFECERIGKTHPLIFDLIADASNPSYGLEKAYDATRVVSRLVSEEKGNEIVIPETRELRNKLRFEYEQIIKAEDNLWEVEEKKYLEELAREEELKSRHWVNRFFD